MASIAKKFLERKQRLMAQKMATQLGISVEEALRRIRGEQDPVQQTPAPGNEAFEKAIQELNRTIGQLRVAPAPSSRHEEREEAEEEPEDERIPFDDINAIIKHISKEG